MSSTSFLNFVNDSLIHSRSTKDGTRTFVNISIPTPESETGFGTVTVTPNQILPAMNKKREVKSGYHTVLLGDTDKIRRFSVKQNGVYISRELTNGEIKAAFDNARAEYAEHNAA